MNFSTVISIISIIGGIFSVILSFFNFISTKKEMKDKIEKVNVEIELYIRDFEHLYESENMSLTEICEDVINYFKIISTNNIYKVTLYKIFEDKFIIIRNLKSLFNDNDTEICNIEENTEFLTTLNNKKPYFINNIPYFNKRNNKYAKLSIELSEYQSMIACPIRDKNNKIIGLLVIYIMNPLNDLINKDNITEFLGKECEIIAFNKEFIEYSI